MAKKMYKKPATETLKVQSKEVVLESIPLAGSGEGPEPGTPSSAPMGRQV